MGSGKYYCEYKVDAWNGSNLQYVGVVADWSVIVFPSFKIVKPFVPIVIDGDVFIFHCPFVSVEPKVEAP